MFPRLATSLCGIALNTPVLASSGTFGYGIELERLVDFRTVGGIVTKGLSKSPIKGNPAPRLFETPAGMMNSVGLQNIGVRAFVEKKLPSLRMLNVPVFANVFGYAVEDYVEVIQVLEDADGISAYELNVSCPNTDQGGMVFSHDCNLLAEVVGAAKNAVRSKRPLIVKLSPNVTDITFPAATAVDAGADALSLVNTFVSLAIDARTRRPRLGNGFGGLSGPAIKPIALRMVYEASKSVKVPIIGLGGIATGEDAAEFLIAGATAVQVGTANFWDPKSPTRVAKELDEFLRSQDISRASDLVGKLQFNN